MKDKSVSPKNENSVLSPPAVRSPFRWRETLVEAVLIVMGVLLALALNQWRENRSERARADAALQHVLTEIRSNRDMLKRMHEINAKTISAMNEGDDSDNEQDFIPGILLKSAAWQALLSSGVLDQLDYERVMRLSSIYAAQDLYRTFGIQIIETTMTAASFGWAMDKQANDDQVLRQIGSYLNLLVQLEGQLLESYDRELKAETPRF